jgi:hypothetical protein
VLGAVLTIGLAAGPARAQQESPASAAGYGALSAVSSLVYAPLKVVYATGGMLVGGIAWVFSGGDSDVANAVITPAVRGDYVVTPAALRGEQPLEFIGREPQSQPRYD